MVLCCVATMMTYAQYADCIEVNEFSPTISRWGADYQPAPTELECWEIDLGVQGHAKITYNIDLELVQALDLVKIYEIDANGNAIALRSFSACSAIGSLIGVLVLFYIIDKLPLLKKSTKFSTKIVKVIRR